MSIVEFFETEESETEELFETVELSIIEQFVINEFETEELFETVELSIVELSFIELLTK